MEKMGLSLITCLCLRVAKYTVCQNITIRKIGALPLFININILLKSQIEY